jgi:8-amino-3,8-dideoxy-alpha-D-manno-octulosonate transaminase
MCGGMADMDSIMEVCNEHNLTLVEDAGQAMGASYKGTKVGLFGKTGCYSFDFFKIATCGEGGVLVTNDEKAYRAADSYADHGHDHIGNNRGMENHPILGFNYRISELHAAIGLAQMRKVPTIMEANNKNKAYLVSKLKDIEGLGFAKLSDPSGDSATFLNLLFQDQETAANFVASMNQAGVGGFNYWFTNMYHFINQWNHIKEMKTASKLAIEVLGAPQDYNNLSIPNAQNVIGRLVSFGIRCTWTTEELDTLIENIKIHANKAVMQMA